MGVAPNFGLETWKTARSNQIMTHGLSAATQTKLDYPLLLVTINAEFVYRHAPWEVLAYKKDMCSAVFFLNEVTTCLRNPRRQ